VSLLVLTSAFPDFFPQHCCPSNSQFPTYAERSEVKKRISVKAECFYCTTKYVSSGPGVSMTALPQKLHQCLAWDKYKGPFCLSSRCFRWVGRSHEQKRFSQLPGWAA